MIVVAPVRTVRAENEAMFVYLSKARKWLTGCSGRCPICQATTCCSIEQARCETLMISDASFIEYRFLMNKHIRFIPLP